MSTATYCNEHYHVHTHVRHPALRCGTHLDAGPSELTHTVTNTVTYTPTSVIPHIDAGSINSHNHNIASSGFRVYVGPASGYGMTDVAVNVGLNVEVTKIKNMNIGNEME